MSIPNQRGDVVWVNLEGAIGAEKMNGQNADGRTCLIIQNNKGNAALDTTIVAPLTEAGNKRSPVLVFCKGGAPGTGVVKDSVIDCGQIRTIDVSRISKKFGKLSDQTMSAVGDAIKKSFGLAK